ncbi:hypothetical protein DFH06DRAFT_1130486 [Mycena polygramma]|nr:hypothetical protein DFH06DRAFT_1130486 [Mycena polygramma]
MSEWGTNRSREKSDSTGLESSVENLSLRPVDTPVTALREITEFLVKPTYLPRVMGPDEQRKGAGAGAAAGVDGEIVELVAVEVLELVTSTARRISKEAGVGRKKLYRRKWQTHGLGCGARPRLQQKQQRRCSPLQDRENEQGSCGEKGRGLTVGERGAKKSIGSEASAPRLCWISDNAAAPAPQLRWISDNAAAIDPVSGRAAPAAGDAAAGSRDATDGSSSAAPSVVNSVERRTALAIVGASRAQWLHTTPLPSQGAQALPLLQPQLLEYNAPPDSQTTPETPLPPPPPLLSTQSQAVLPLPPSSTQPPLPEGTLSTKEGKGKRKTKKGQGVSSTQVLPSVGGVVMAADAPQWLRNAVPWLARTDLGPQYTVILSSLVRTEAVFGFDLETYRDEKCGGPEKWGVLDRPGPNGCLSVGASLYFWGVCENQSAAVKAQWWEAVEDVAWILEGLEASMKASK